MFENIETGKQYIVTSTHFDFLGSPKDDPNEKLMNMRSEANELITLVDELSAKYNVPIYMTGDYNCVNNVENWKELFP